MGRVLWWAVWPNNGFAPISRSFPISFGADILKHFWGQTCFKLSSCNKIPSELCWLVVPTKTSASIMSPPENEASDLFSHEYMFAMKPNLFTKKPVLNITLYCHSCLNFDGTYMLTEICSENSPFHLSGISASSLLASHFISKFYGGNKGSYPERGGKDGRFIFSRIIGGLRCIFAKSYPSQWRASVRKLMWKFSHFWIWIYGFMLIYGFSHLWIFLDALPL